MRADLSREGLRRPMGPACTPPTPRSTPRGRCARGVETRPSLPFTPGCPDDYGAADGGKSWLPEPHRGDRRHDAGRTNDDADGRGFAEFEPAMLKERTKAGLDA